MVQDFNQSVFCGADLAGKFSQQTGLYAPPWTLAGSSSAKL
jgi:hypothetical protein